MSIKYYLGTIEDLQNIDKTISDNCGWPDDKTQNWANPILTINPDIYALQVPEGSHGFTKQQMINGVDSQEHNNVEIFIEET